MKNDIFFIHSAGPQSPGNGSSDLVSYLSRSFAEKYRFTHPLMPDPENPRYLEWKMKLQSTFPIGGNKVAIIGHSLGGSVIVKYLAEGLCQLPIAGLFLVATPYWGSKGWAMDEFRTKDNFQSKLPAIDKIFIYHSRRDKYVPYSHAQHYAKALTGSVLRTIDGDQHEFEDGLPVLVNDIEKLW